jgi:hypothetical protein
MKQSSCCHAEDSMYSRPNRESPIARNLKGMKVECETGEERKLFFYKIVFTGGLFMSKSRISRLEETLSSYLNDRWQFGCMVSGEMCQLKVPEFLTKIGIQVISAN